jgi:hypothetical protein
MTRQEDSMNSPGPQTAMKVTAEHLRRNAYLYVRQSTTPSAKSQSAPARCRAVRRER